MKNVKLFVLMFSLIIISSSISVTAIPTKRIEDKIIPDITNYTSTWIDYNPETKENNDITNLYYNNPSQVTTQVFESVDLTSLIIQITESTVTSYISTLVGFGPRRTGTSACDDAGDWIAGVFDGMGLDVRIQEWSSGGYSGNNIEATLPGIDTSSDEVYLIVAHYDTVSSSPGADDNAAGTAAVLASAEVMSQYTFSHTVKFLAVSGEEQGLYGSTIYADEAASLGINIKEVLDGDMIGYAETWDDQHTVGIYGSGTLASTSQQITDTYPGLIDITVIQYGASGNSDHWPFIQNGYDAAMYSEYHFNPYYHSSQDTIDKMDLDYDMRVTRMMTATLAEFSNLIISDNGGGEVHLLRPRVSIEDPSNGEYIRGTIDIKGKASSISGSVKYVLVKIDDNDWEYAETEETPGNYINWTYSWDTTKVDDGSHLISAVSLNNHYLDSPTDYSRVNVVNKILSTNIIMINQADINEKISIQSFTTGGLPPYSYIWDLGDGTKKYEQNITYTYKYPGEYKVELTVKDSMNNTTYASKTIPIIDDIPPTISIINPENAFYLNNNEVFTLKNPVIIGDIDIIIDVTDNSIIDYVVLYINNQEKFKFTDTPYIWTWDENMFGQATINVVAFDKSGNKANDTINVWKFF
ncbi:MAG: M28 family peptidase [Candidatus Thermoplasmatota archaeon]|nr:M28 family peptidase [Candidatus Thermoplasmatota archaeon]